ncbi:MAG: DUF3365 domain-containing protein [Cyanobacteria bacterium P01_H01_bin.15]
MTLGLLLKHNAELEVVAQAELMMSTMNSIRAYTSDQVKPELVDRLDATFLPETIPAYSVREVFETLRQQEVYSGYTYKEAVLNPTNPRDAADAFEQDLIKAFQTSRKDEVYGVRSSGSGDFFYIARPIQVTKESCLECHGSPKDAPASMLALYGDQRGFNWPLNETLGTQLVSMPVSAINKRAQTEFFWMMALFVGIFTAAIWAVNYWIRRSIVRPVKRVSKVAEAVSTGDLEANFTWKSSDEIGNLVSSFSRLKTSLAIAMKRLERK